MLVIVVVELFVAKVGATAPKLRVKVSAAEPKINDFFTKNSSQLIIVLFILANLLFASKQKHDIML